MDQGRRTVTTARTLRTFYKLFLKDRGLHKINLLEDEIPSSFAENKWLNSAKYAEISLDFLRIAVMMKEKGR